MKLIKHDRNHYHKVLSSISKNRSKTRNLVRPGIFDTFMRKTCTCEAGIHSHFVSRLIAIILRSMVVVQFFGSLILILPNDDFIWNLNLKYVQ